MPHLTLEYSSNIELELNHKDLFAQLHRFLKEVGGIRIDNFKSRALKRNVYLVGRGDINNAFVHLEVRLLEGRSPEIKKEIGQGCLLLLKEFYAASLANQALQITVEIVDIARKGYFKHPDGTL
jgi:5-carboxymethyl-2-hydroxymuconate isomerase